MTQLLAVLTLGVPIWEQAAEVPKGCFEIATTSYQECTWIA